MNTVDYPHTGTGTSRTSRMPTIGRRHTLVLGLLITMIVSIAIGTAAASHYQAVLLVLAAVAIIAAFASIHPTLFGIALVAMLVVPYTWSPTVRTATIPAMVLFALPAGLAGAGILVLKSRLRLCVLDYLVVAVFSSALLSELFTESSAGIIGAHTLSRGELETIVLPYVAFRLIVSAWPLVIPRLPDALLMTGAGLSLFAVWEELMGTNLFAHSSLNNPQLALWEVSYPRAGAIRVDATMGHPIAFGSFLIIPLVFAFAGRRWRLFALLAVGEALTLSRGPYIAAIAALLLYSILARRVGKLWILFTAIAIVALFIGPVRSSVTNSFQGGTSEQRNANYRADLLSTSLTSVTMWGKPSGEATELFGREGQFALTDVTSEFALMAGRQGIVGLTIWVTLLAAFAYALRDAIRRRDSLLLMLGTALVGEWIALLSVALITSFQYVFWLTVALTAARLAESRHQAADDGQRGLQVIARLPLG